MADYSKMTDEDFDKYLENVIDNDNDKASHLLSIAGIYEVLSEQYHDTVLDEWANDNPELAYPEDNDENEDIDNGD